MSAMRESVLEEARSWIGTPFHDCSGIKGAGTDCVHYLKGVFVNRGVIEDFTIPPYPPQWYLHSDDPLFIRGLQRYADVIEKARAQPADIVMYTFGRQAAHGAIVVDDQTIIHAFKYSGCVCFADRRQFQDREHSFWRVRGIE